MKTKTAHCLPILVASHAEVCTQIQKHREKFEWFEVWLDYLDELDTHALRELTQTYPDAIIFVTRRLQLEPIKRPYEARLQFLETLRGAPCLFDFDIRTQRDELDSIRSFGNEYRRLVSYHNYESTPTTDQLEAILSEMDQYQPAVSKLACYCRSEADGLRLLSLLLSCSANKDVIILGMGEHGLATRVLGPLYGNRVAFSPLSRNQQSAPGQLTFDELESILEVIDCARK